MLSLSLRHNTHESLAEHLTQWHTKLKTLSGVRKSSSYWLDSTGLLGDTYVACKQTRSVAQLPLGKKKTDMFTTGTMSACEDQLNTNFSWYILINARHVIKEKELNMHTSVPL